MMMCRIPMFICHIVDTLQHILYTMYCRPCYGILAPAPFPMTPVRMFLEP